MLLYESSQSTMPCLLLEVHMEADFPHKQWNSLALPWLETVHRKKHRYIIPGEDPEQWFN